MMRSEAAQAAAIIRKELKQNGIKASVKSDTYSMGSSVRVSVKQDVLPIVQKRIESFCSRFAYQSGMDIDDSPINSFRDDVPQARFVFVNFEFSDELRERAKTFVSGWYDDDWEIDRQAGQLLGGHYQRNLADEFWRNEKPRMAC